MWIVYLIDSNDYPNGGYLANNYTPDIVGVDQRGNKMPSECIKFFPLTTLCPW